MFLALRDLRFARGRFALMGAVIALISFMVVMLSGLTNGLGRESTAAITSLNADRVAIASTGDDTPSFATSRIDHDKVTRAEQQPGVDAVNALTIANGYVTLRGRDVPVSFFSGTPGAPGVPAEVTDDTVVVGPGLDASTGDGLEIGSTTLKVGAVSSNGSYSHLPVVWLAPEAMRSVPGVDPHTATALLLRTGDGFSAAGFEEATGLSSTTPQDAVSAIGSYNSEHGSLLLMRVMLLLISALVIGAFFTVWTVQRTPDLAVLKAMGASTGYLLRDAIAQAAILLLLGGGIGTLLATVIGHFAADVVPMEVSPATTLFPLAMLLAVGLAGAAASLRRIATVDPIAALGSAR